MLCYRIVQANFRVCRTSNFDQIFLNDDYDSDNALIDFYRQIAPSDNDMFLNCDKETIREAEIAEEYIAFDFQFSLLF